MVLARQTERSRAGASDLTTSNPDACNRSVGDWESTAGVFLPKDHWSSSFHSTADIDRWQR
jgi:hypothetical protein